MVLDTQPFLYLLKRTRGLTYMSERPFTLAFNGIPERIPPTSFGYLEEIEEERKGWLSILPLTSEKLRNYTLKKPGLPR